jgi:hypothetical protein
MSIELPLRSAGGDEFLEIPLDALPEVDELLDVLRGEQCPIRYWLALAVRCAFFSARYGLLTSSAANMHLWQSLSCSQAEALLQLHTARLTKEIFFTYTSPKIGLLKTLAVTHENHLCTAVVARFNAL